MSAVKGFVHCPVQIFCGHGGRGGSPDQRCRCPPFLVQKTSDFSKFRVCPQGEGLSHCGHFSD